jgi:hypothetical protein
MRYWILLLLILYVLSPIDIVPEYLVGPIGWLEDAITVGLLYWYFIYRPGKMRARYKEAYRRAGEGTQQARYRENRRQEAQTEQGYSKLDPYKVLGVHRGASIDEIKAAYRELAAKYHPDKVNHLGDEFKVMAEKKFKEIQEAYQTLVHK